MKTGAPGRSPTSGRSWPLVLVAVGPLLILGGFVYDVVFAGIPYQDPTPEMSARYALHSGVASAFYLAGAAALVVGIAGGALRRVSRRHVLLAGALLVGALITGVDASPGWDDTGVTVGVILLATLVLGALGPERPWLWGLAVGAWIPLVEVPRDHNWGAVAALVVALVGAYAGGFARRIASPPAS